MRKGSFVKYIGEPKRLFWRGRMLSVASVDGDMITVYTEQNAKGKWGTATIPKKDVEVVIE